MQPIPELIDCRVSGRPEVPATILRGLPAQKLVDIEKSWTHARDDLATKMAQAGKHLESQGWRWTRKEASTRAGEHVLLAVEAEGEIQGLLALKTRLRPSLLIPAGWVLYVDYVESAPWNQRVQAVQEARFAGVGTLLIGEAIRTSMGRTSRGRLGLHALPQAEDFYAGRCRMKPNGPDSSYHNLIYFEHPDALVESWLTDQGLSA